MNQELVDSLVSIITPCYNSEKYISDTIESVIKQKYKNWEMIIVDDFSSDNSVQIIEKYVKLDSRIILVKLDSNKGAGYARNKAIKKAKGQYYAFLDSDDLWNCDKLSVQIQFMEKNNIAFSYSNYNLIESDNILKNRNILFKDKVNYYDLLKSSSHYHGR